MMSQYGIGSMTVQVIL